MTRLEAAFVFLEGTSSHGLARCGPPKESVSWLTVVLALKGGKTQMSGFTGFTRGFSVSICC